MNITLVTVTYGARAHLLAQTLDAAKYQAVVEAVVVDNGSTEGIKEILAAKYGGWAHVVEMGVNSGSAAGFAAGIQEAVARGAQYILLLDDDNVMDDRCLVELRIVFQQQAQEVPFSHLLGCGFRVDRHQWMISRLQGNRMFERKSSFRGFHVLDIPQKLRGRLRRNDSQPNAALPRVIYVAAAAYGGMFFHRSLVDTIGLPDQRYFLYEDDIEYSRRVLDRTGLIFMATGARITESDTSWNHKSAAKTSFARWVERDAQTRRYYAFRNGTYNDFYRRQSNKAALSFNMALYMSILFFYSLFKGRLREFGIVALALRDGLAGHLEKRMIDAEI